MKKFAYAKINLTLEILKEKPDGYHMIKSVFQKISLHDTVEMFESSKNRVIFTGFTPNGKTTVEKAMQLFREKTGIKTAFYINVKKEIPIKSGLGGGSSDAAAILIMLNKYFKNPIKTKELIQLAKRIGADVPFFLNGKTAIVEGIGEKITPINAKIGDYFVIIATPKFGYSTKEAYDLFDKYGKQGEKNYTERVRKCLIEKCTNFEKFLYNDFENVYEKIDERFTKFKNKLFNITEKNFHLTGSGSAMFSIYREKANAEKDREKLSKSGINVIISKFK